MRIRLSGEFNEEYLNKFIDDFSEIPEDEPLDIYLSTNGGYAYVASAMAHILNQYKKLRVFVLDDLSSAGFYLCLNLNCPIQILDDFTTAIIHISFTGVDVLSNGTPKHTFGKAYMKNFPIYLEKEKSILEKVLTKEELEKVLEGEDILLNSVRLKEIYETKSSKKRKV